MRINQINLQNFRNVEEATYYFPTNFTAIIGMNGAGKSTILHGLRIAAGTYFTGIPNVNNRSIKNEEIRQTNRNRILVSHYPVVVEAIGSLPEQQEAITWRRRILKAGGSTTSSYEDIGILKEIGASKHQKMEQEKTDQLDLPVVAYFGTNRVFGSARRREKPRLGRQIFKEGYHDWQDMRSGTYQYTHWLETYDALVKNGEEYETSKEIFFTTIKTACPYIKEIEPYSRGLMLKTTINDIDSDWLPLELQSDGIITFVNMVAELAYRCIVLNGYSKERAILDTTGIVLIDELDLHLHPKWQEQVVDDLKAAFPNIQFIVTTHSPIIVQSLKARELINLDRVSDVNPDELPLGEVATDIMGLESEFSAKNHQQEQLSEEYLNLLNEHTLDQVAESLDAIEYKVMDPAVRAFLQMQRLKKETNN